MFQLTFNPDELIYQNTINYEDNEKDVVFVCDNFVYSARCYNDIIQYIKGQRPHEQLFDGSSPTPEQLELHDLRRELFNGDHEPLQIWINSF
jgi:hypothetical protein